MEAIKDVMQTRLRIEATISTLETRKEKYDYNGRSIINSALTSLDQCVQALKILEENERNR